MEGFIASWPQLLFAALAIILALTLVARIVVALVPSGRRPRRLRRRRPGSIRVIGVGGGGSNAVNEMVRARLAGVDLIACNTDAQALRDSPALDRVAIGAGITHGLGSGGDPSIGHRAAEEDAREIGRALRGADLVFVTAGLGGGTGSGAAPVVAGIARDGGALTVGIVTKPFAFEGVQRRQIADQAVEELRDNVDTLIIVPNDRVRAVMRDDAAMVDAFQAVDDVLRQIVEGIINVITVPGLINLDFADVRAIMKTGGPAVIGIGRASGPDRAVLAAAQATSSPLLEVGIEGAHAILFHVSGPGDITLAEVTRAAEQVRAAADPSANIIFGASFADDSEDEVTITIIATGVKATPKPAVPQAVATIGAGVVTEPQPAPTPGGSRIDPAALEAPSLVRRKRAEREDRKSGLTPGH